MYRSKRKNKAQTSVVMPNYSKPKKQDRGVPSKSTSWHKTNTVVHSVAILSLTSCVSVTMLNRQTYKEQSQLLTADAPAKQKGEQPEASMKRTQPDDYITAWYTHRLSLSAFFDLGYRVSCWMIVCCCAAVHSIQLRVCVCVCVNLTSLLCTLYGCSKRTICSLI